MSALTRDLSHTIAVRLRRDRAFRQVLLAEAVNVCIAGETRAGIAVLRELVNATVGFKGLAVEVKKPSMTLRRMLTPHGNPSAENFFDIVKALQKKTRVRLRVTADLT